MGGTEYKIKATLDATGVRDGAREAERAIGKVEAAAGAAGKKAAPKSAAEIWGEMGTQQRTSMILGGTAAIGSVVGAGAEALGHGALRKGIDTTLSSMRQLGTMLAPLGPQAAAAGAGLGLLGGAVTAVIDASVEGRKKLEAAAQAGKNMRADAIISRRDLEALPQEERAREQGRLRKLAADVRTRMDVGADVAWGDIKQLAYVDPDQARRAIDYQNAKTGYKDAPPEMLALRYALGYKRLAAEKKEIDSFSPQTWKERRNLEKARKENNRRLRAAETMPDIVDMVMAGGDGWDPALDKLLAAGKSRKNAARGGLRGAGGGGGIDSMQSMGVGVVANPMKQTETLLSGILAQVRGISRAANRQQGAVL